ncbi:transferase [Bordetella pertussis]|nr:transferase [Bordetella pertussis]
MGEAGRRMVRDEKVFAPERLAERTEAIYRQCTTTSPRPAA